ncbi:MAG: endonuclease/exonuclease/phosphatase family protein [Gemmatimonadota bacterium]|nr:MAG: endonuclease/exonuclease/phosphatase family protein [Gemmatimonadota bacterium]
MRVPNPYVRRHTAAGVVCAVLLVLLASGCDDDRVTGVQRPDDIQLSRGRATETVTVMTFNVYVGADVDAIIDPTNPYPIPVRVAQAFQQLHDTYFADRAEVIADEIERQQPHLIGLQEISLIRRQTPSDFVWPNAEDVVFDYLDILMSELGSRGLDYQVAGVVENFDIEMPMYVPEAPLDDVRLTDYDVVLARGDVDVSNKLESNYGAFLGPPYVPVALFRGYVAVDATVNGRTYRFVNTHLEPASEYIQGLQAEELMAVLASAGKPVILVGDLNTEAPTGATYQYIESQGYLDVWTRNLQKGEGEGLTNPHDLDLLNPTVDFTKRIDLIFVRNNGGASKRPALGPVYATVWGDELHERLPSGMWASDHAAVIAELWIPILGAPAYK